MTKTLFVGNVDHNCTENDLHDYFTGAGAVTSVNIIQDRATGRSRGFAFVEMGSEDEAKNAIQLFHGKEFQGRSLTVNEARPREPRPPYGGAGRGGRRERGGGGGYRDRR
ncbi:MAG: RNA-binding protein [Verrucomicrobia bacterium]|nr:RNA-binding protein [Verrucomicrobiota bacterium]